MSIANKLIHEIHDFEWWVPMQSTSISTSSFFTINFDWGEGGKGGAPGPCYVCWSGGSLNNQLEGVMSQPLVYIPSLPVTRHEFEPQLSFVNEYVYMCS
jgi:hypothetical protein